MRMLVFMARIQFYMMYHESLSSQDGKCKCKDSIVEHFVVKRFYTTGTYWMKEAPD